MSSFSQQLFIEKQAIRNVSYYFKSFNFFGSYFKTSQTIHRCCIWTDTLCSFIKMADLTSVRMRRRHKMYGKGIILIAINVLIIVIWSISMGQASHVLKVTYSYFCLKLYSWVVHYDSLEFYFHITDLIRIQFYSAE